MRGDCTVTAGCAGVVNAGIILTLGDIISAGTVVATIVPENEAKYKVQLYVENSDISSVEAGNEIRYNIVALPAAKYGTVRGTVTMVGKDVVLADGEYSGYYVAEGDIENKTLYDRDSNPGVIGAGMRVEGRIITQRKRIIVYLLEKLNLY